MNFNDFDELLQEDTASGGSGVLRPHPVTLLDLTSISSKIQQTQGTAPPKLPYPGEFLFEDLANIFMDAGKMHARLTEISNNAVVTQDEKAKRTLKYVQDSLCSIKKLCRIIAKQLDGIQLTNLDVK